MSNHKVLHYNIPICFKISKPSQMLPVKIKPKYLIESAYKIGNEFINSEGNNKTKESNTKQFSIIKV